MSFSGADDGLRSITCTLTHTDDGFDFSIKIILDHTYVKAFNNMTRKTHYLRLAAELLYKKEKVPGHEACSSLFRVFSETEVRNKVMELEDMVNRIRRHYVYSSISLMKWYCLHGPSLKRSLPTSV